MHNYTDNRVPLNYTKQIHLLIMVTTPNSKRLNASPTIKCGCTWTKLGIQRKKQIFINLIKFLKHVHSKRSKRSVIGRARERRTERLRQTDI